MCFSKHARKIAIPSSPSHQDDQSAYGCRDFSYVPHVPSNYKMYPVAEDTLSSSKQISSYPLTAAPNDYQTANQRAVHRGHIYERAFIAHDMCVHNDLTCDDNASEHTYFVLDPNYIHSE